MGARWGSESRGIKIAAVAAQAVIEAAVETTAPPGVALVLNNPTNWRRMACSSGTGSRVGGCVTGSVELDGAGWEMCSIDSADSSPVGCCTPAGVLSVSPVDRLNSWLFEFNAPGSSDSSGTGTVPEPAVG